MYLDFSKHKAYALDNHYINQFYKTVQLLKE